MGFFDLFKGKDINRELNGYKETADAVLLDVRTPEEFRSGHIPGSMNIPLQELQQAESAVEEKDRPVFVYCQSGGRSRQAAAKLKQMGYTDVTDLGGISSYRGEIER